jgi:hypothetical protein
MSVYKAINAVQADLSREGISKDRRNQQQGYNFRGIDDVYNALSPLLAKHGLCILPRILTREVQERQTVKGGTLFYVTVEAEFDFVASEDGSRHTVRTFGEAMDSGDKATNKAMSAAYKYAAFQAFAIPTEADNDADAHTHAVAPSAKVTPLDGAWDAMSEEAQEFLLKVATGITDHFADPDKPTDSEADAAHAYLVAQQLEAEEKMALWTRLNSKARSALKKANERANKEKAE